MTKWKEIKGHEDYLISESGSIFSMKRSIIMKPDSTAKYPRYTLSKNSVTKRYQAHRLVAVAFIGDPPTGQPWINHIDGNKQNCHYSNLEWCNCSENTVHAFDTGLRGVGEKSTNAKLSDLQVHEICRLIELGYVRGAVLRKVAVSKYTFDDIRSRKTWKRISCHYTW